VERDRAQLARAQTLSQRGVSSEASLETAQTALAASESSLARIQATIDLKAIEAPFAGTIGIPRIDVGQYVQPGTVIATLQQLSTMRVDFTVPEQRIGDVRVGQEASFGLTESEFPYTGRIVGVDPKVDPQTRLVSVRAEVENSRGELRPGQFVRVRVALPTVANVIALPQTSVVTSLYGDYVYVVEPPGAQPPATGSAAPAQPAPVEPATAEQSAEPALRGTDVEAAPAGAAGSPAGTPAPAEDAAAAEVETPAESETPAEGAPGASGDAAPQLVARQVFVQVGRRQGNLIEVTEGLQAGQTVVTSGQNKLANNAPVTVNNEVNPAAVALGDGDGRS
jgi:membrane fusion protein (multidrug efflux system)